VTMRKGEKMSRKKTTQIDRVDIAQIQQQGERAAFPLPCYNLEDMPCVISPVSGNIVTNERDDGIRVFNANGSSLKPLFIPGMAMRLDVRSARHTKSESESRTIHSRFFLVANQACVCVSVVQRLGV
jgi:hypothetical protein